MNSKSLSPYCAVFAFRVGADVKAIGIGQDAVSFEDLGHDLRHRHLLENPLIVAELQIVQRGHQPQVVTGQAFAQFTRARIFDMAVNTFAVRAELQERRLVEQTLELEITGFADDLDTDGVQATDGFGAMKRQHLEVVANGRDLQREVHSGQARTYAYP
jgi:hypothetical protein